MKRTNKPRVFKPGATYAAGAGFEDLELWLAKANAPCLWQQKIPRVGRIEAYAVAGNVLLVQVFDDKSRPGRVAGWEVYVPVSSSTKVVDTIEALDAWSGRVVGPRGGA